MNDATRRPAIVGRYAVEEMALAARNSGMPLESLRHDGDLTGFGGNAVQRVAVHVV